LKSVDGAVELQVCDTGVGIPEEQRDLVFERFHRIESIQARTYEGTGIGLALVLELVKLHGGTVRVESAVGGGSTFSVTIPTGKEHLPAERIQAAQSLASTAIRAEAYEDEALQWSGNQPGAAVGAATLPRQGSPSQKRELIVVADDNADMRQYLARLLSEQYKVHAVVDGRQALEATERLRPALVLADVMMPQLDGFGLLRAIREDSTVAATPVILVSARAGEESRVEGLGADADDYLIKPFAARELLARVAARVKMANLRRETAEREERMRSEAELEREKLRANEEQLAQTSRLYDELRRADAELQLQAGLLHRLPVSTWTLNPDGTPDFVNQVWLDYSGQTLDFVRSHPEAWMTAVHPEDRETAARTFWEGVHSGQGFAFETRSLRAKDGVYRWHLNQAVVLRDSEGKVLKFVGTTTDIDDQKRAEEALIGREHDLKLIIDTIPTLSWCNRTDGSNEFLSKSWHDYTGLPPEEAHGWGWQVTFHPEDLPPLMNRWGEMLASGEPGEIEARLRRWDGTYRWFLIRAEPFRDESGTVVRWYGTSTDIEDRKRGEEALRESEQSFRLILDGIAGLVAIMSATGEIEVVNRQVLEYFGRTTEQLKDWSTGNEVHPNDLPYVYAAWVRSLETKCVYDVDHRLRRADGVYRWFHARGLPLCDSEGHVLRWYVLLTDIDDRNRAEEALRQALGDLARINRVTTMGELTASLAHEISQPIGGALTNANVGLRTLGRDNPNLDEVRGVFARIVRDAQRAAAIINRIRSQFEKGSVNQETLDVSEMIRETVALLRGEVMRYNISIRTELAADLPLVLGDRVQLQQVAMNLIVNSIEAMKDVDGARELVIKSQRAEHEQVLVSVCDTGPGFPPELAEQIFNPFFTTKPHGTGMGLRISRSIIESHGGRLWAEAAAGRGATFYLNLPATIPDHSPHTPESIIV